MTDTATGYTDRNGAPVEVRQLPAEDAYGIFYTGEERPAGKAHYLDREVDGGTQRVFHHTAVDVEYGGRGLAGVLVNRALEEARAQDLTVVPVCSYVAHWIGKNAWDGKTAPVTDEVQEWVADQG